MATSELANSFPEEKVLSVMKYVGEHYYAGNSRNISKFVIFCTICNMVIDTWSVLSMFDEFCVT